MGDAPGPPDSRSGPQRPPGPSGQTAPVPAGEGPAQADVAMPPPAVEAAPAPQLSDALVSVSERRAEAAQLRELEGWSNKQIARHLGVHPSTVGRWFGTDTKEETP